MYELCIHMNNKSSCFLLNSTVMTSHPTQAHIILKHIILNKGVYSRVKENQCLIQYSEELSCCWFSGAETDLGEANWVSRLQKIYVGRYLEQYEKTS